MKQYEQYEAAQKLITQCIKESQTTLDKINEILIYRKCHLDGPMAIGWDPEQHKMIWIYTDGLMDGLKSELKKTKRRKMKRKEKKFL